MAHLPVKFKCHIYHEVVTPDRISTQAYMTSVHFDLDLSQAMLITTLTQMDTAQVPLKVEVIGSNNEVEVFTQPIQGVEQEGPDKYWTLSSEHATYLNIQNR